MSCITKYDTNRRISSCPTRGTTHLNSQVPANYKKLDIVKSIRERKSTFGILTRE